MFLNKKDITRQYSATNIWLNKEEFMSKDVVYFHGALNCKVIDKVDKPSVLMNHSGLRQHTFLFNEFMEAKNISQQYFIKQNRDEIIKEFSKLLQKPDVVISNSEFIRNETKKWFGVDSFVIHPPVDREKFCPVNRNEDYYVSVQRMDWTKRIDAQIKAFKELDEELRIIGEGLMEKAVEQECEKYDNIHYLGHVSEEELVRQYAGANATIQTCMKEDFGLVPREGMACGTPAIVPNEGGLAEAIHNPECGITFDPGEPRSENLRQAVKNFNPNKYDEKRLRKESEKYDLEKTIKPQMEKAVKLAIKRHKQ